ncbi:MAG: SIMPL domain-containing protein [Clostridium sp.]|uniref:SIMPL domain-containing protein n=1 Tax=Clostridium sp. TaxID=1506 RepID=UPI003F3959A3
MKTIKVRGTGKVLGKASSAIIFFKIAKTSNIYNEAINSLNEGIYEIIEKLKGLGIKKDELNTVDFFVDGIDGGFYSSHKVSVKVKNEGRNINNVLEVLVKSGHNPEVNVYFKSDEEESLREEALIRAILDGKKKGEIIIKSLGGKKVNILEVTYDGEEISREMSIKNKNGYNYNKIFEEIEFIEKINIVFEI